MLIETDRNGEAKPNWALCKGGDQDEQIFHALATGGALVPVLPKNSYTTRPQK